MNVDPMQELYYGINPYAYVFNNPIQLVDPTGMVVEYADDPNKTKKENRQARREFKKLQRELNIKSSEAKKNWNTLKNSKHIHTIHINVKNEKGDTKSEVTQKDGYTKEKGGGTNIYVDTQNTKVQGEELGTSIVGIAHEEGHAFRFDQGLADESLKGNMSDPDNFSKTMIDLSNRREKEEIETSHIENIVRAQIDPTGTKIPLRKTYNNLPVRFVNPATKKLEFKTKTVNVIKDGYDYYKKTN